MPRGAAIGTTPAPAPAAAAIGIACAPARRPRRRVHQASVHGIAMATPSVPVARRCTPRALKRRMTRVDTLGSEQEPRFPAYWPGRPVNIGTRSESPSPHARRGIRDAGRCARGRRHRNAARRHCSGRPCRAELAAGLAADILDPLARAVLRVDAERSRRTPGTAPPNSASQVAALVAMVRETVADDCRRPGEPRTTRWPDRPNASSASPTSTTSSRSRRSSSSEVADAQAHHHRAPRGVGADGPGLRHAPRHASRRSSTTPAAKPPSIR